MSELDELLRRKAGLSSAKEVIPKAEIPVDTNPHIPVDTSAPRGGTNGSPRVITIKRSGRKGSQSEVVITRGGTEGTETDNRVERPGGVGSPTDQEIDRGGGQGINMPVTPITRPGQEGIKTAPGEYKHKEDTNPETVNRTSDWKEGVSLLDTSVTDVLRWFEKLGIKIPNVTQANELAKLLTGGHGVEWITNANLTNEALIGYFTHLYQNGWNLARIPVDIGLRLLLEAQTKANAKAREIEVKGRNEGLLTVTQDAKRPNLTPTTEMGEYLGYEFSNDQLIHVVRQVSSILKKNGFADMAETGAMNEIKDADSNEIYAGTYKRWRGFEFSDNFYWGLRINPFDSQKAGYGESLLPTFPSEFSSGWWPVTSCSFTKGSLKSKSFQLPFFNLEIPHQGERPSNLKMSLIDNARHAFRYWLEDYVRKCFDIDNNLTLPYKNICFDITVYRYDCNYSILYRKRLICLLSQFNAAFMGVENHSSDEIDLDFEIVGDYPEDDMFVENHAFTEIQWPQTTS